MAKLADEDGVDGPFDRAMKRAEREDAKTRQRIPVVKADAGVLQPPVRSTAFIDEIFEATRAAITEAVCPSWSVAQHARRAS